MHRQLPHLLGFAADNAFIGGGTDNRIYCNAAYGVIGGGLCNLIDEDAQHGFIGAGECNTVTNAALYSTILNGDYNTINSNHSIVLGGSGNTIPAGMDFSVVFGNGITATAGDMLFASQLNALNTQNGAGGLPPGTIFYSTVPIPGAKQLYIV